MVTLSPQITAAGISGPSYADIYAQYQSNYWGIYGSDAQITPDTQDGQWIGVTAQAKYDVSNAIIAAFQSFSPATAQGTQLSSLVKINGLTRVSGTFSNVQVQVVGTNGTVINNGIIGDNLNLNTQWTLPAIVTIPAAGTITVTATCTQAGAVAAGAGTLTQILTPTYGWQSVTNAAATTPVTTGTAQETDAALRIRQASSASLPALSNNDALKSAIAGIPGAGQTVLYENYTGTTDGAGRPPNSITLVVQGGAPATLAAMIKLKKSPGSQTYGTSSYTVLDSSNNPYTVSWYYATQTIVNVTVTVKALGGYVASTGALIQNAVAAYISNLGIGNIDYVDRLFAPAELQGAAAQSSNGMTQSQLDILSGTYNVQTITQARGAGGQSQTDIITLFYEYLYCNATTNVTIVTV